MYIFIKMFIYYIDPLYNHNLLSVNKSVTSHYDQNIMISYIWSLLKKATY